MAGNKRLPQFCRDESGQTLVLAALCMSVLIGMLGLSIDAGMLRNQKRLMQNAADAAALAGALELPSCGSTPNCAALQAAAQSALKENGFPTSTLLTNCATSTSTGVQLTVNNSPCALSDDPNNGKTSTVEVIVSSRVPTVFARILGINSVLIAARAEAIAKPNSSCIYALDPSGSGSLILDSSTTVTASCKAYVESTSSSAAQCTSASFNASAILIAGGIQQSGCSTQVSPVSGATVPSPPDPLASLPKPAIPACGTSTTSPFHGSNGAANITGNAVLYPDRAFCGGILISASANVTFMPGTYVIMTSGNQQYALHLCVQGTVSAKGVTFYSTGVGAINLYTYGNGGNVSLTAPTSGTYAGILFFQDPNNTTTATIIGATQYNTVLEGVYYFPSAAVAIDYNGSVRYNLLIAKDIHFENMNSVNSGQSTFTSDYSTLSGGSPLGVGSAVVVQ